MGDYSRRTSYYGGEYHRRAKWRIESNGAGQNQNPYLNRGYSDQSGYYGARNQSRPDSLVDGYQGQPQDPNYYPYSQSGPRRPRQYSHMPSDQAVYGNGKDPYASPQQSYQRSTENITAMSGSGSGSGYTDSYGQYTDPSSLNSSMDQLQQYAWQQQRMDERAQPDYGYGYQGSGGNANPYGKSLPMTPPAAADPNWGGPVGGIPSAAAPHTLRKTQNQSNTNDKRKSWFKRRFSKD